MIFINTTPIESFISQVKSADNSNSKEIRLDIQQAKTLSFTLGMVMSRINSNNEEIIKKLLESCETVVQIDGGGNWGEDSW